MTTSIIVAIAQNHAIGKNNQLLWHLPTDLKHFKNTTSGHTVIMGRKTFDSVGKPLPKRRNIVITRQNISIEGCEVVSSVEDALALCAGEDEVFIVGGAEIYKLAMPLTDKIYLTIVHHDFEGDTYFPEIDYSQWNETARTDYEADDKHAYAYSILTLERR
ncbi:dihydrofolate reductase [Mucilaginibacter sp. UR6-1]|nr:dihydrofolate reductase [Mucilaginibacter sp. UR6-1]MCC8410009.1 dihydrofolate reductase [Mucilaginibacter sp. UR6-1]